MVDHPAAWGLKQEIAIMMLSHTRSRRPQKPVSSFHPHVNLPQWMERTSYRLVCTISGIYWLSMTECSESCVILLLDLLLLWHYYSVLCIHRDLSPGLLFKMSYYFANT